MNTIVYLTARWKTNVWKELITISGAWIQAVGTVVAALSTLTSQETEKAKYEITGHTLQGLGSSLQVIVEPGQSLEKTGNEIQALGNATVITGYVLDLEEKKPENEYLEILGNSLQATGAFLAFLDDIEDFSISGTLENSGNILQTIGNGMQVIQGLNNVSNESNESNLLSSSDEINKDTLKSDKETYPQKSKNESTYGYMRIYGDNSHQLSDDKNNSVEKKEGEKDESLGNAGSWIQAAGSIMTAIGTTLEGGEEENSE
jgi:hypothetical protein